MSKNLIEGIVDGRTDLVFDYLGAGHAATSVDKDGVPLNVDDALNDFRL
jgi:hypothetical protein